MRDREEDLVQDACLKLLCSVAPIGRSRAFLRKVAWSVVVDEIRRTSRRAEDFADPESLSRWPASRGSCPEGLARDAELWRRVRGSLERLAPDRRAAVDLYLADHGVPEVAALRGWSFKRASNLVYRGLGDLRSELGDLEPEAA